MKPAEKGRTEGCDRRKEIGWLGKIEPHNASLVGFHSAVTFLNDAHMEETILRATAKTVRKRISLSTDMNPGRIIGTVVWVVSEVPMDILLWAMHLLRYMTQQSDMFHTKTITLHNIT